MLNYRHPGHGAWEGGLRPAPAPLPGRSPEIPGDRRRSPDEFQITHFRCVLLYLVTGMTLRCNVSLCFCSYRSQLKPVLLRAFLECCFPEMRSKVCALDDRNAKSPKTLPRSVARVTKYSKTHLKCQIWNSSPDPPDPPDPADPADQVSGATARDLPSKRAGGQYGVSSKQTPSNYL